MVILFALSSCTERSVSNPPVMSMRRRSNLIERLQTVKQTDWNCAINPNASQRTKEDCLDQMNKADRTIKELHSGFDVLPKTIADALWVPPESITNSERAALIRKLEQARREDDHNEQKMLNDLAWSDSGFPADTATFDQQKALVDSVIEDLEIGEDVHWSKIKEALYVPTSPY